MLMSASLLEWRAEDSAHFGRRPLAMRHRAHLSPLFSDAALIRMIDATPRDRIHVNTMPRYARDPRRWRERDLGKLSGEKVMEAVARGNLWLHLRRVHETDPAHGELLDALFGEIADHAPGFQSCRRSMSVLISSPKMSVAYHSDVPGQSGFGPASGSPPWSCACAAAPPIARSSAPATTIWPKARPATP